MKTKSIDIKYKNFTANLFSWTSAMQCWSFSLPAGKHGACPTAVYKNNSVCNTCYAMTGFYNFDSVLNKQYTRLLWLRSEDETIIEQTITDELKRLCSNKVFRLHDSGDFFSLSYIDLWYRIAQNVPDIRIWAPTRGWRFPGWKSALEKLESLENVCIRNSGLLIDVIDNDIVGSTNSMVASSKLTVPKNYTICPKTKNHSNCEKEKCRACWDKDQLNIAYIMHGRPFSIKEQNKRISKEKTFVPLRIIK